MKIEIKKHFCPINLTAECIGCNHRGWYRYRSFVLVLKLAGSTLLPLGETRSFETLDSGNLRVDSWIYFGPRHDQLKSNLKQNLMSRGGCVKPAAKRLLRQRCAACQLKTKTKDRYRFHPRWLHAIHSAVRFIGQKCFFNLYFSFAGIICGFYIFVCNKCLPLSIPRH